MLVEDKQFTRLDGTVRKLVDIINELITRVQELGFTGLTNVDDIYEGGENYAQIVAQGELQYDLEYQMELLNKQQFLQSMSGGAVEDYGDKIGLYMNKGDFAVVPVTFTIQNPADGDLRYNAGTRVYTQDAIYFLTSEAATILNGQKTVTVPAICEEIGKIGNVREGAIRWIDAQLIIPTTVRNNKSGTGGSDDETHDEFKERIINSHNNYTVGTPSWYEHLALEIVAKAQFIKNTGCKGTISYVPKPGVTDSHQKLTLLFSQKENDVVNMNLTFIESKAIPVITPSHEISVSIDKWQAWDTVQNIMETTIIEYVDGLEQGDNFVVGNFKMILSSVPNVLDVILNSAYKDVNIFASEHASISGEIRIKRVES